MSEFADFSENVTESLISAVTCVIICFMNMVANKGSKKCSIDDLMPVVDFERVISKQDDVLDQSSLQANKHVIEYFATIFKKTPYGRQRYYTFCVNLELELFNCAETESGKQTSYLLNIRNMRPVFHNISNPILGQFCCLLVQMLLHIFEIRILFLIENQRNRKAFMQYIIQVKLGLQKFCLQTEDNEVTRNKLYNDFCDDLGKLYLNIGGYKWFKFDVLTEKYQRKFYQMFNEITDFNDDESTSSYNLLRPPLVRRGLGPIIFFQETSKGPVETGFITGDNFYRYHKEFQGEVFIAGGGFGKVYKARHCLDDKEYAIKKITVKYITEEQLNEVKILAALSHPNIVPYNTAWIESLSSGNSSLCEESSSDVVSFRNSKSNENPDQAIVNTSTRNSSSCEESSSDVVSFRNSKSNENPDQAIVNTSTRNSSSCEESSREINISSPSDLIKYSYTLYIQMALCEQTLEQWLRDKISVTPELIFQQIIRGVDYIHSQKIVHHDIKPSNIFMSISGQLRVQLGDFGLACRLDKEHSAIGTLVYAAPEQLQGKCDPKSDIYSIGVVFIELLISIKTQMELIDIIKSLKSGEVPETLKQHKWAQIIQQLVQEDPTNRPSASQLLQEFNHDEDVQTINRLRDTIVHLENNINNKDDKIQNLLQDIALLKEKIQELSMDNEQQTGLLYDT